ncbi:hypothetical protein [Cellulomonas sp. PSBB021]|uniref:hypothetical protein n=1 Tax=Cellulomonas sp. PSBB021 TaxID=2003551 RepID=UPI000B8D7EED|nr:hypothetical protein [Cellulomonas sp. PSBB021]ASR55117.1 hypothetical protein CBP52_08480 [Cellulomonas sp. PSBB021]
MARALRVRRPGLTNSDVRFIKAARPSKIADQDEVAVCTDCQATYGMAALPPGTKAGRMSRQELYEASKKYVKDKR